MNDGTPESSDAPVAVEQSAEGQDAVGLMESADSFYDLATIESEQTAAEVVEPETEPDVLEPAAEDVEGAEESDPEAEEADEEEAEDAEEEAQEAPELEENEVSLEDMKKGQSYINKKIGKATKRFKEAEAAKEVLETELAQLKAQPPTVVSEADQVELLRAVGLNPALSYTPQQIGLEHRTLSELHDQLQIAATDPAGLEEGGQLYTQQQVMQKALQVKKQIQQLEVANGVVQRRTEQDGVARSFYPQLFDTQSDAHAIYQNAMRSIPGLQAVPNSSQMVGDMLVGKQIRAALGEGSVLEKIPGLLAGTLAAPTAKKVLKKVPKAAEVSPAVKPKAKAAPRVAAESVSYDEAGTWEDMARLEVGNRR